MAHIRTLKSPARQHGLLIHLTKTKANTMFMVPICWTMTRLVFGLERATGKSLCVKTKAPVGCRSVRYVAHNPESIGYNQRKKQSGQRIVGDKESCFDPPWSVLQILRIQTPNSGKVSASKAQPRYRTVCWIRAVCNASPHKRRCVGGQLVTRCGVLAVSHKGVQGGYLGVAIAGA